MRHFTDALNAAMTISSYWIPTPVCSLIDWHYGQVHLPRTDKDCVVLWMSGTMGVTACTKQYFWASSTVCQVNL